MKNNNNKQKKTTTNPKNQVLNQRLSGLLVRGLVKAES